jgi:hypothetical protein
MSYIGPLTQELLNKCIDEFKKKNNRDKLSKNIIDPIVNEIKEKFYNYYILFIILQLIIVCLLVYIVMIIKSVKN